MEQDASRQRRPRFRASVVMTTTVPTSTQVEDSPKTRERLNSITFRYQVHRSRRIFGISWGPESGLHQVTPWRHETLPHQAAREQLNTKAASSRHAGRVNRFLFFLETTFAFFELKPRNLLIFEQVGKQGLQTRLVFHFGNTNTGTGGAVRFPKTGSKIGCSFLSRQYQNQSLSKNGKQVSLIFE